MKNLNILRTLMIVLSGFLFIQCTSDLEIPDPIAGPPGVDGINGIDGTDGVDGTTTCVACHSSTARDPIEASFLVSRHATGDAYRRGSSATCAQCHGEEGYVDYITTGAVKEFSLVSVGLDTAGNVVYDTLNPYPNVSPMNCTTCHDRHNSFDFENDGFDYALRNIDAVTLVIDNATVIDFEGSSNNCISCHQPRNSYPVPGGTDSVTITSSRYGPHHGPQSTMLEGIMASNIPGSETYPAVASGPHRTGSSCVNCHMGQSSDTEKGLHSWNWNPAACVSCHPNVTFPEEPEISGFTADYETLKALLIAEGAITASGSAVQGTFSAEVGQATWNFRTLLEDNSRGVHNPEYTRALLKNSIDALQN